MVTYNRDADLENFREALRLMNESLENNEVVALSYRLRALKAAGLWDKLVCDYPIVGQSIDTMAVDLKNPVNRIVYSYAGAPDVFPDFGFQWTATGLEILSLASRGTFAPNFTPTVDYAFGMSISTYGSQIIASNGGIKANLNSAGVGHIGDIAQQVIGVGGVGTHLLNRQNSTLLQHYKDGVKTAINTELSVVVPDRAFSILYPGIYTGIFSFNQGLTSDECKQFCLINKTFNAMLNR